MSWTTALPYWKIFPFILYVCTCYYVTDIKNKRHMDETWESVIFKAFPVVSLIFIVLSAEHHSRQHLSYIRLVFLGLLLSMGGDACLVWRQKLFLPGLLFFAAAHVFYTFAFGLKPFGGGPTMTSCAVIVGFIYFCLYPHIPDTLMKVMVLLYSTLIFLINWRSLVLLQNRPNLGSACAFIGSFTFGVSDLLIALDKWGLSTIERPMWWIMLSYFTAQLFIALSAAAYERADADVWKKTRKKTK